MDLREAAKALLAAMKLDHDAQAMEFGSEMDALRAALAAEEMSVPVAKLDQAAAQIMGAQAPLRMRIRAYLRQCAPHVAERQASKLLAEVLDAIAANEKGPRDA